MMVMWVVLVGLGFGVLLAFSWRRIVPPSEAHIVRGRSTFVASGDSRSSTRTTYYAIPGFIPGVGRSVKKLDITIKELVKDMETYEKDQGRYRVRYSIKYRIKDVVKAAETFVDDSDLQKQLDEVVQAAVRAVTVKHSVADARAKKKEMGDAVDAEIKDDLEKWGLELINFVLVDFQDTPESNIISDISKRREVEIASETRELNAEKLKQARMKEAEAEENARKREIEKERVIAQQEQEKKKLVAEKEKEAREKELEVQKVQTVRQAEIDKEEARIQAEQRREVEEIKKQQKQLEGEGDRLKLEEIAKGEAAQIKERGFADAEVKQKLQEALSKFGDEAIRALVAEKIVEMQKAVGLESAKALSEADLRIFLGSDGSGKGGFDMGQLISAMQVSNNGLAESVLHRLRTPNDLGIGSVALGTASTVAQAHIDPLSKGVVAKE